MAKYSVVSLYFFKPIPAEQLASVRAWLIGRAQLSGVLGLVILGTEGVNTTLACEDAQTLGAFVASVTGFLGVSQVPVKESVSDKAPFRRFVVKVRKEIVTLGRPEFVPRQRKSHLSPEEWHAMLDKEGVVVVDTRNDYEYEIGTFKNAIDMDIKEFTEFPEKIQEVSSDKKKPHLIFCTGGIRCEKAIYEMEAQGYEEVYQLDGGILNYMEKYPDGHFNGECFVFDSRVALNQELKPSKIHSLCPQCGEVGNQPITCLKCEEPAKICSQCLGKTDASPEYSTCSKNCRHHYLRNPNKKGPQQKQFYHS